MIFKESENKPGVLAWYDLPWYLWLPGVVLIVFGIVIGTAINVRRHTECSRGAGAASRGGACRIESGVVFWGSTEEIPLSEIVAVDIEEKETRHQQRSTSGRQQFSGPTHTELRPVLRTVRGDFPIDDWSDDSSSVRSIANELDAFLAANLPSFEHTEDHRLMFGAIVALLVLAGLPLLVFPRRASCVLDRNAGTVTATQQRLFGRTRTVRALSDLHGIWIFEADPDSGRDRYRLGATDAAGARVILVHKPKRRDVLEASVRDLRKFLGLDVDVYLEPPRPDLAPKARFVRFEPPASDG